MDTVAPKPLQQHGAFAGEDAEAVDDVQAATGFDNEPPAELQAKRMAVELPLLPRGVKVYSWTDVQVWLQAADGAKRAVSQDVLSKSRARLARFGNPCDTAAISEFQRYVGGYTWAEPQESVPEAWASEMRCGTHVTYAVASGRCRFELSQATRDAPPGERIMVRATAGDGVTCLGGVPHRIVPEMAGTAIIPLFNENTPAEARARQVCQ